MQAHAMARDARPFASAVNHSSYSMVRSGPDVPADEVELAHTVAIEVMVLWDTNVLHVSHLTPPRSFYVGEETGPGATCDYAVPSESLGTGRAPVVVSDGTTASIVVLPGMRGHLDVPGQGRTLLADLVANGSAHPCAEHAGAQQIALPAGAKARLVLAGSPLTFQVSVVNAGKRAPVDLFASADPAALAYSGMSFLFHAGLIALFAFFMPPMRGDDSEALDRDQIMTMQKLLNASAQREQEERQEPSQASDSRNEGGSGAQAKGAEGAAGKTDTTQTGHRYAVAGPKENPDPHLARQQALVEAAQFGMVGIIATMQGGDPNAPTAPWGRQSSSGTDEKSAMGNMFGGDIGDSIGMGGLGLTGTGEGGSGRYEGIGLDGIGGLGNGVGGGTGGGIGHGKGLPGRSPVHHGPQVRDAISTVNGRLPPEVIQRVVRQNFGRFRLCYENGIRGNPNLQGRVAVKFVIDRSGAVATALDGGSDLPDQSVVQCVVRGFTNLSFPQPDNGMVTVVYPIVFSPGEQ